MAGPIINQEGVPVPYLAGDRGRFEVTNGEHRRFVVEHTIAAKSVSTSESARATREGTRSRASHVNEWAHSACMRDSAHQVDFALAGRFGYSDVAGRTQG